jgi:hypothetical protein
MAADPSGRLDYRSGVDAVGDDARAMHRSVRTWVVLLLVWTVGMGVWVVYLAGLGYLVLRLLA